jgi:hypothetical protein
MCRLFIGFSTSRRWPFCRLYTDYYHTIGLLEFAVLGFGPQMLQICRETPTSYNFAICSIMEKKWDIRGTHRLPPFSGSLYAQYRGYRRGWKAGDSRPFSRSANANIERIGKCLIYNELGGIKSLCSLYPLYIGTSLLSDRQRISFPILPYWGQYRADKDLCKTYTDLFPSSVYQECPTKKETPKPPLTQTALCSIL